MNDWYVEETLKNYARIIKAYCSKRENCEECPFAKYNGECWKCVLMNDEPDFWEV